MNLRELLDKDHSDIELIQALSNNTSLSNTAKVGDTIPADTEENRKLQRAIDELNKIIYDFGEDQNSPILVQATNLRDQLKAQIDTSLPDTEPATQSVGRGLEPAIFSNIG